MESILKASSDWRRIIVVITPLGMLLDGLKVFTMGSTYNVPTENIRPTAIFLCLFIFSFHTQNNGIISKIKSWAIADPLFAYAKTPISIHLPSTSRFQNARTGVHANIVRRKIARVLMIIYTRTI